MIARIDGETLCLILQRGDDGLAHLVWFGPKNNDVMARAPHFQRLPANPDVPVGPTLHPAHGHGFHNIAQVEAHCHKTRRLLRLKPPEFAASDRQITLNSHDESLGVRVVTTMTFDRASNKNRGSVLSIYMVILYGAMGLGMFLLNFSNPGNFEPFILISIITSAALIPILLTKRKPPTFKKISSMSIQEVFISSPFGMVSSFFYGTIQSALFTLLAVYAATMNFSIFQISLVTFLLAVSGAVSQWPIGKLSDMFDRRKVIIIVTFAAAFFAFCAILSSRQMYLPGDLATSKFWFYVFLILFSFCSLPMFSLILAHTNDFIPKEKFVAAGASLQFIFGMGAMAGPFLCSIFMGMVGPNGFFIFLLFFHSVIGFYGVYRSKVRPVIENPDSQFVAMPQSITPAGIELNPSTEPIDDPTKQPLEPVVEEIKPNN